MSNGDQASSRGKSYGYRELVVWQKGMGLAKRIYGVTHESLVSRLLSLVSV